MDGGTGRQYNCRPNLSLRPICRAKNEASAMILENREVDGQLTVSRRTNEELSAPFAAERREQRVPT
jgi:hypothetical protein